MNLAGRITAGSAAYEMQADMKFVARFKMPKDGAIAKGSVALDGLGGGALGPQVAKLVIYDASDNGIGVSDEVVVALGQPPRWVDFPFLGYGGKLVVPKGDFYAGLHAGNYGSTIRVYGSGPRGAGSKYNFDTYSDGTSAVFGAATASLNSELSVFLTYFTPYMSMIPDETDLYYSRLPFAAAQAVLGQAGPEGGTARLVDVGWHDTFIDPEVGSVALVRDGSDFADLLGQRIKVTTKQVPIPRSVIAYVHNLADADAFDWDLSLSRHLFSQLGILAEDTLPVIVEVLG